MSGSLLTDLNDYHHKVGLKALQSLLLEAVEGFAVSESSTDASSLDFPAPLCDSASQDQGVISRSEIVVESDVDDFELVKSPPENLPFADDLAGEKSEGSGEAAKIKYTFNLQKVLGRFALLEGTTKIWDSFKKTLMLRRAFDALITKSLADEWSNHPERRLIDNDAVKVAQDAEAFSGEEDDLSERFVMLEGTLESWDTKRRERVRNATIKENFASKFDIWIKSDRKRMIHHTELIFDPRMKDRVGCINMFEGLPAQELDMDLDEINSRCGYIQSLLFHLCEGKEEIYNWVLCWLALPLQKPGTKMDTALLFHGFIQGAGKSLFFDKVMRQIYGKYSAKLGQGQLDSQYSEWKSQNLYTVFEEVASNNDRFSAIDKVKDLVTADTTRIEMKFVNGWEESSYINFVFLSNHVQPLPIEPNDRRFLVSWPNSALPEPIREGAADQVNDPESIRAFYTYLINHVDTTDFNSHTKPLMTKAKERIIDYGLPNWEVFFSQWQDKLINAPFISCTTHQLFTAYRAWCIARSEKIIPENKFVSLVSSRHDADVKKERCWYEPKNDTRKQAMMFVIGSAPAETKKELWLGDCVFNFNHEMKGGSNDVPDSL
jgi:putative DNA primase/helicase